MENQYYQLNDKVTIFYDPTQSKIENEKLLVGQVKQLDNTKNVQNAFKSGAIFRVPAPNYIPKEELEIDKKTTK